MFLSDDILCFTFKFLSKIDFLLFIVQSADDFLFFIFEVSSIEDFPLLKNIELSPENFLLEIFSYDIFLFFFIKY